MLTPQVSERLVWLHTLVPSVVFGVLGTDASDGVGPVLEVSLHDGLVPLWVVEGVGWGGPH